MIDCNRHPGSPGLVPAISDGVTIPGNLQVGDTERTERLDRYFTPYHDAVEAVILDREARGVRSILLSVHSMTENLGGKSRPWQIALSSYRDRSLADPLLAALRSPGDVTVGDNEPYDLDPAFDYSTPFHALRRGLPHIQVEFRQDEISEAEGQQRWANRFADSLRALPKDHPD